MSFKLLIIEDDERFLKRMKEYISKKCEELSEKYGVGLECGYVGDLEAVERKIARNYYIGVSIDQKIHRNSSRRAGIDDGSTENNLGLIKHSNALSTIIILSNYPYDIKFTDSKIGQENYFNKGEKDVLKRWSAHFLERSLEYLQKDIYQDATKILPLRLGNMLSRYLSYDYDDKKRIEAMVRFFELDLKFIYASVLSATGLRGEAIWQNARMIDRLEEVRNKIWDISVADCVKSEISKLLCESLMESLEALRKMRDYFTHKNEDVELTPELQMHFANLVLHNNYFYANPLIYVEHHEFENRKLHVRAQILTGSPQPYAFELESEPYIENRKLYQLFERSTKNIVSLDKYIERDRSQSIVTLKLK